MRKRLRSTASSLAFLVLASACGGGSDLRPDEGAVRFYSDQSFRSHQPLALLTFEGGLVYGFYQSDFRAPVFPEYVYAGFFVAQPASQLESGLRAGREYSFDAGEVSSVQLELEAPFPDSILGRLTQVSTSESATFSALESADSERPTDRAALPGTYAVQARSSEASFKASGTVDASGNLSLIAGACTVTAELSPRRLGNLYDAAATLSADCPLGAGPFSGHAVQSYGARNVFLMLTAPGRRGVMLLLVPDAP